MSYKIVALFGQSGAGKDTLLDAIIKMDCPFKINKIITTTTRPPREYETEGIDYHFISVEEFAEKILSGEMLEATSFNDWFYGTTINDIKENMVNAENPEELYKCWQDANKMFADCVSVNMDKKLMLVNLISKICKVL